MLTLNDGRSELWQWDTGRTLAVDADCSQVHFSNKVFGRSIDVDVAYGVAIIPDILLQTDKDLNVWAFAGTAENGYTKISKTFKVNRRNKPADYVFTPTDQMTLQTIQRQIGDLSDLTTEAKDTLVAAINEALSNGGGEVDPKAVQQIVNDYLAANPPSVTETDPTVPAWAKAAEKPAYTAAEVGADLSGTAEAKVAAHNTRPDTHRDIRLLISGLTDRLNALADSDDATLDQLSEVVAYIKSNRSLIEAITTSKVSVADIVDNLTTNASNKPLSAAQGVALKGLIDAISIPDKLPNPNALTFTGAVSGSYDGSEPLTVEIPSGGGEDELPIIQKYTIEAEDVNSIEFTDLQSLSEFELTVSWDWQTKTGSSGVNFTISSSNSRDALKLSGALNRSITGAILIQGKPVSKSRMKWTKFFGSFVCYNNSNSGISTVQSLSNGITRMNLYTTTTTVYFPVGTVVMLRGK